MAVGTEELVLPLTCVPAHKVSPGPAVKRVRISYHLLEDEFFMPMYKVTHEESNVSSGLSKHGTRY